jgi:hypothetical protein
MRKYDRSKADRTTRASIIHILTGILGPVTLLTSGKSRTADFDFAFDYLIGAERKCRRDIQPKRLGCPHVDHQFELGRLLHRQIARLTTPQNTIDICRRTSPLIDLVWPIRHHPALDCEVWERINRRRRCRAANAMIDPRFAAV